jgi:hypothetical protein
MDEFNHVKYLMAAEKLENLIHLMDQTHAFMLEFKISPDEEVKKVMKEKLDLYQNWIK